MIPHTGERNVRILAAVVVGMGAAFFTWYPISDGDIFWHLAAAREMVRTHTLVHNDPFSFTSQQTWQWINLHWLYQLCMYGCHVAAGFWGILCANSMLFGAACGLLFFGYTGGRWVGISSLFWLIALHEVRYFVPHRPIVASLLFLSLFLVCLEQYRRTGKRRFLVFLIPVQVAWVNFQPLFVLGPVVFASFFAGEWLDALVKKARGKTTGIAAQVSLRSFGLVFLTGILLCVAALANPYGIKAYGLALLHYGRIDPSLANLFAANIPENTPLLWLFGTPHGRALYATTGITVATILCGAVAYRSIRFSALFVALCMLLLAFRAQRNIVLYFFAVLPFVSTLLPALYELIMTRIRKRRVVAAVCCYAALALPVIRAIGEHGTILAGIAPAGPIAPFSFPKGSIAYLSEHEVGGNLFNADRYGGYLLWHCYPARKVFADTRYAIRPSAFFAAYLAILENQDLFRNTCSRYRINAAVIPTALTQRYAVLAASLVRDPAWRLVYTDGAEALFVRDSLAQTPEIRLDHTPTVDSIARKLNQRWRASPLLRGEALGYLREFAEMAKQASLGRRQKSVVD